MKEYSNPAWRLFEVLSKVINFGNYNYGTGVSNALGMRTVWMESMGIDDDSHPDARYLDSITEAIELAILLEQTIKRNPSINQSIYLPQVTRVKTAIFQVEAMSWNQFSGLFNQDFLSMLQTSADALSNYVREEQIDIDALESLQSEIHDLGAGVIASDIPPELKDLILDGLASIGHAIQKYRIYGIEGLKAAVDRNIGTIYRCQEKIRSVNDDKDRGTLEKYKDLVLKLNAMVTVTSNLIPLAQSTFDGFQNMLGGGD